MRIFPLALMGLALLAQDNAAPEAAKAPPKEAPKEAPKPLLSPMETAQLMKLEQAANAASAKRKELEGPYAQAIIAEKDALLVMTNGVRMVERHVCGKSEALVKPDGGGWQCYKINPQAQ